MVEKIAASLVNCMRKEGIVKQEQREYYEYAFIVLIERILGIGTLLLIGFIRKQLIETSLFLFFFFSLRKRTGGYHAGRFYQCYILSVIVYLISMKAAVIFSMHTKVLYVSFGMAVALIEMIGTVNHPSMELDERELAENKKMARIVVSLETVVILWMSWLEVNRIYVSCMMFAVILCAVSLAFAKIIRQEVEGDDAREKSVKESTKCLGKSWT